MKRLSIIGMLVLAMVSALAVGGGPPQPAFAAQGLPDAGFVSGQWRVVARQTVLADGFDQFGLKPEANRTWIVVLADVTNLGSAGPIALGSFGVATDGGKPGSFAPKSTAAVNNKLGMGNSDTVTIAENSTVRVALAFAVATSGGINQSNLALALGDQSTLLGPTISDVVDPGQLPAVVPAMQLEVATIQSVDGNGNLTVSSQSGGTHTIALAGTATPPKDGCYGAESAQAIMDISGGQLWLEKDEGGTGYLAWANDASNNTFVLLNERLIAQGDAGYQDGSTVYGPWLKVIADHVKQAKQGLWQTCRDVAGTYINPPTPTAEQVRAQYEQIDVRDLVIRPLDFKGKKITVAGSVFNIRVTDSGTFIQIWATTVDGSQEAVDIGYFGDSSGIYEGTYITVYGVGAGTVEGTNAFGGDISQPIISADIIDH